VTEKDVLGVLILSHWKQRRSYMAKHCKAGRKLKCLAKSTLDSIQRYLLAVAFVRDIKSIVGKSILAN